MGKESLFRDAVKRFSRNKMATAGGIFVLSLVVIAIFAPYIAPYHYADVHWGDSNLSPNANYMLGTDYLGRDLLSRLIYGARVSLAVGFLGAFTSFLVGVSFGSISGYFGGVIDSVMMRFVDLIFAFPRILFVILLMVVFKSELFKTGDLFIVSFLNKIDEQLGGLFFIMVGLGLVSWVGLARLSRGMALSISEEEYIMAARAAGSSSLRIIFKHLIPNLMGPCIVSVTLAIPGFISLEAFLSFIGLGVQPPVPSWGGMISEGYAVMRSYPHLSLYPSLALALTMFAFNFLGDGLRDAFDVQMEK